VMDDRDELDCEAAVEGCGAGDAATERELRLTRRYESTSQRRLDRAMRLLLSGRLLDRTPPTSPPAPVTGPAPRAPPPPALPPPPAADGTGPGSWTSLGAPRTPHPNLPHGMRRDHPIPLVAGGRPSGSPRPAEREEGPGVRGLTPRPGPAPESP